MMGLDPAVLIQMSQEQQQAVIDLLSTLHNVGLKNGDIAVDDLKGKLKSPDVLCGLEFVLQSLGAPGYEWS